MTISLPLEEMTVEEKLQVMEMIWEDLSRNTKDLPPPPWHGDVLKSIESAIERGDESYEDWDIVKKQLRDELESRSGSRVSHSTTCA